MIAASYAPDPQIFTFFFGFCYGLGAGFITQTSLFSGWSHLGEENKNYVTGILIAGQGVGGCLSSMFFCVIVNRANEPSFFAEI